MRQRTSPEPRVGYGPDHRAHAPATRTQGGPVIDSATTTLATARPSTARRLAIAAVALVAALAILPALPAPASAATTADTAAQLVTLINRDRSARGLTVFRTWTALSSLAADRAARMASTNTLSHTAAGGSVGTALNSRHIQWYSYGEAIGYSGYPLGTQAADHLFSMWMNSSPHRALILSSTYNYIGVGIYYKSSTRTTWASLVFTESADHTPAAAINGALGAKGTTVDFSWSGTDPKLQSRTAGLRSFDVQYRVDWGSWMTVRNDTTATSLSALNRARGHWYGFRVQAADRRGNLGKWTSEKRIWVP